jgi:hypothetical protein
LCAIESHLPREGVISKERKEINENMAQILPISIVNVNAKNRVNQFEEEIEDDMIDRLEMQELVDVVNKGGYRSVKNILQYIIPDLINKGILNPNQPLINVRISGDGRNVGKKIKHVMITFAILDNKNNLHKPDYHYTTVLYPGCENYSSLSNVTAPFCSDLRELNNYGLLINHVKWNFKLHFSSDWKFLAICLGFNAANSKYFCPWCTINKSEQGDLSKEWKINKQMDKLVEKHDYYKGHSLKPLFDMIPLNNWIPDELHIMLRITDHLWNLVISELKENDLFNAVSQDIIIKEMKRIKVNFHFWQNQDSKAWKHTSLMGEDKLKVLRFFNLSTVFQRNRADIIRNLWNKFYELYIKMKASNTNTEIFRNEAKEWLTLFLTPSEGTPGTRSFKKGLYHPNEITPYIHVFVHHIPEFMEIHKKWGIKAFSCSAVEKKNHDHTSFFFKKTTKNGGKKAHSAIIEILENENRILYHSINNTSSIYQKPQTIRIKTFNN